MQKIHLDLLKIYRRAIIYDVDVNNGILKTLKSEFILNEEDFGKILEGRTKEERAKVLLDILPRCGPFAFDIFFESLKQHYDWLIFYMTRHFSLLKMSTSGDTGLRSNENPPLPVNRNENMCHYIYTQAQSLALLAKALDISTDRLPSQAKQIHNQCKGMPLLISKFATEFESLKEQLINSEERWQHYQKKRLIEKIAKFLDTSIKELDPDLQVKFYKLAIFDTDVNIPSKTLGHLWGLNHLEVDEKMIVFCQKGLAVRKWQEKLKSYVYIINETVLSHLKLKLRPKKLKKLHRLLIQKYREVCKDDFAKLPDDNYSYTYIGHHLEQAQLYELFEVYLNLEFVQAKIINAGLSNLFKDIQIYEKHIIRNSREIKLNNLITFLKDQRKILIQHEIRNCLDVVQVVFYHTKGEFLMRQARKLAKKRCASLYISALKNLENDGVTSTSTESTIASFNKDISTICHTKEPNSLLVATTDGGIHLKNVDTLKSKYFSGFHEKKITKLILAHEAKCFLALSDEGKAKLFFLNGEEMSDNENNNLHPREKQKFWTGFFSNEDDSCQTFDIENDFLSDVYFSPDDKFIVGCTPKGTIQVWNKSGEKLQTIKMSNNCFSKITFTTDLYQNVLLHVMDEKLCLLVVYQYGNNKFEYKTLYNPSTLKEGEKMKIIFFEGLPNEKNSLIFVSQNKAVHVKWLQEAKHHQILNFIKRTITGINEPDTVFVGATLTLDGQNLIIAKSDGWINVWRVYDSFEPVAVFKGTVTSLDTHWIKDQGYHRFFGSQSRLIYKWKLNKIQDPKPLIKPLFNAIMKPLGEDDIVVKRTTQHKIDIFRGKRDFWQKISEVGLVEGLVTTMILSEDGNNLIYDHINVNKRQEIFHFDIQRRISNRIDTLETVSNFIKIVTNLESGVALIYQNNRNSLRVYLEQKASYVVKDTGDVLAIHEMDKNQIITVERNFVIKCWAVFDYDWKLLNIQNFNSANETAISSTLSPGKTYLAVLNGNHKELVLYNKIKNNEVKPALVSVDFHEHYSFEQNVTCYEFSENEQYLAIGFDDGEISVLDVAERKEMQKLSFHCNPVCELHWAPTAIKVPILLSANTDDLIWWSVSPVTDEVNRRRSRMGRSQSPSPQSSFRIKTNQSNESQLSILTNFANVTDKDSSSTSDNQTAQKTATTEFWQSKAVKRNQSALLTLIPLPSGIANICVSKDFKKFLTLDIDGHITTFEPFGHSEI